MNRHDPGATSDRDAVRFAANPTEIDVMAAIADVAREHLNWTGPIEPDLPLVEALALDSLRQLTLVVEIENHFRIRFDREDESSVKTFGDLVAVVRRKLEPGTSHAR